MFKLPKKYQVKERISSINRPDPRIVGISNINNRSKKSVNKQRNGK